MSNEVAKGYLHCWFQENEKQKEELQDHVGIAIERQIKTVAREMKLKVGGQLPTGMRMSWHT